MIWRISPTWASSEPDVLDVVWSGSLERSWVQAQQRPPETTLPAREQLLQLVLEMPPGTSCSAKQLGRRLGLSGPQTSTHLAQFVALGLLTTTRIHDRLRYTRTDQSDCQPPETPEARIQQLLRRRPWGLQTVTIQAELGLTHHATRHALSRLVKAGLVRYHRGRPGRPTVWYAATPTSAPATASP